MLKGDKYAVFIKKTKLIREKKLILKDAILESEKKKLIQEI